MSTPEDLAVPPSFESFAGAEPEEASDQIMAIWEPPTLVSEVSESTRDSQLSLVSFGLNVILLATTSLAFLVDAQEQTREAFANSPS